MALAAVFVANDVYRGFAWASLPYYRVYLLIAMGILLPHVIWWQQRDPIESRVRMIGTALLAVAVIHDNVPEILPWSVSLEVYGVSAFILSLGYVTTRRFFADQRELAAVERELETARVIQTSILPRELPALEGLRIAVHYVPVRSVAGDVYDFLTIDDRRLAVLVADVAGHGVSAALIGSMTTVAFSSQKPHGHDPSRVLTEINRVLYGHFDARYVTAACLFVDLGCHQVRYSLAGHPPPLLWKARTRQVVALSEGGTVLGLFEDIAYPSTDVPIEPGDRLVLYTDGVSEVSNRSGEWFGDRALAAFVGANAQLPAASFVEALLAALARWSGREGPGAFDDDVTLVVIDV
jgi:serine phosphatase RsbU (regulator of sigma subunit)